ncbi:hypothetical protein XENOCAPTIV_025549, partial [Xenoophorus captivus]
YIIELCRIEQPSEMILSYLDKMTSTHTTLVKESDDELVKLNFLELIQILLKDPEEKNDFFMVRLFTCSFLKSHLVTFKNKNSKQLHTTMV